MILFDVLLNSLGGVGASQIIILFLLSYSGIPSGFNALGTVFIAYRPDFRCNVPPLDNSTAYPTLSENEILNLTTPYNTAKKSYDTCKRYGYDLDSCDGSLSCVNKSYPAINCDEGYHFDKSVFTETVVTEFNLVCDRRYLDTLGTSLYYVGILLGSLLFGNFADAFGRKRTCVVSFSLALACMFAMTFSNSMIMYMLLRMATAAFMFGTTVGSFVYAMEIVGKEWRTICGMGYLSTFPLGYMILGGFAYNWRNWHHIMLACSCFSVPFLIFTLMIPESPRWLFTKMREKEGIEVTLKMARINRVVITEDVWEQAIATSDNVHLSTTKTYTTIDLFKYKRTLIVTLKVMFSWFVISFVYYGVSLNAGALAGDLFVNNTLNGVMELASYLLCILLMDRIGRRLLLTAMLLVAGVGLIASVVVNLYAGNNNGLITFGVVLAFLAKVGISGAHAIIYNFTSELYPTVTRSNAIGLGSMAARIGGIIAPYVISLQDHEVWLPNTVFGVFGILGGIMSLTFPETNGYPMLETIEEAEQFYKTGKGVLEKLQGDSEDEGEEEAKSFSRSGNLLADGEYAKPVQCHRL